jgi:hypothetical protein
LRGQKLARIVRMCGFLKSGSNARMSHDFECTAGDLVTGAFVAWRQDRMLHFAGLARDAARYPLNSPNAVCRPANRAAGGKGCYQQKSPRRQRRRFFSDMPKCSADASVFIKSALLMTALSF